MTILTASEARASLYRLIDEAAESHQPILIAGKRSSAVHTKKVSRCSVRADLSEARRQLPCLAWSLPTPIRCWPPRWRASGPDRLG